MRREELGDLTAFPPVAQELSFTLAIPSRISIEVVTER